MNYKSDIEIAQEASICPICEIAGKIGIEEEYIELYGKHKAKIHETLLKKYSAKPNGKLILVTAITPTPSGEGKTTITVGLGDALNSIGAKTMIALREPSLGPVFGMKGGAAGGGYAQVVPMEDINLHFTGDMHAITSANNLLAAMLDNHIYFGNSLGIDNRRIQWKRAVDMNDRQLRSIVDGMGGKVNGVPREDGFDISVASEVMAVLCLSEDIIDLKERLSRIVVAYTREDIPVTAGQLNAHGAMAALLKDAIKPNLVQTLAHTPAFVHGGPFANIAHGCNSLIATKLAMKMSDYVVTEAGFGADLGAEKFLDIKCRMGKIAPSAVVIVATVRALKHHGGVAKCDLCIENTHALRKGMPNLEKHIENITKNFCLPAVVAINKFPTDTDNELQCIIDMCSELGVNAVIADVWGKGAKGGEQLAKEVLNICVDTPKINYTYSLHDCIHTKIQKLATIIYGAEGVAYSTAASKELHQLQKLGYGHLPICIAKTQYSISDNPTLLGRPEGFIMNVKNLKVSAGAGFIVVMTGDIMTMPGLPQKPAALNIDVDINGTIKGLF